MEYKITRIQHTGSLLDRTDDRYPLRIGRIVDILPQNLSIGFPAFLPYVKDSDGSDYFGTLVTSRIVEIFWDKLDYSEFRIQTNNSIYSLVKVEK